MLLLTLQQLRDELHHQNDAAAVVQIVENVVVVVVDKIVDVAADPRIRNSALVAC